MEYYFDLSKDERQRSLDVHRKSIVIDGLRVGLDDLEDLRGYFRKLVDAGFTASNVTAFTPSLDFEEALDRISERYMWIESNSDRAMMVTSVSDFELAKKSNKFGLIFGTQNTKILGDNISRLKILKKLGLMIIQLTYQYRNYVGDGCGERTDSGLSKFGTKLVEAMDESRITIDLSHVGKATSMDAMEIARSPVVFSHSNAKALCNHPRNIDDDQIKAVAEKRGVIGVAAYSPLLVKTPVTQKPKLEILLDQIDYMTNLVGVNHVGLGLDIAETPSKETYETEKKKYPELYETTLEAGHPEGLESPLMIVNITMGLVKRGYSDAEIGKILGGNFVRVFGEVWGNA